MGLATISLTRCARNYPNLATNSTVHMVSLAAVVRFNKIYLGLMTFCNNSKRRVGDVEGVAKRSLSGF